MAHTRCGRDALRRLLGSQTSSSTAGITNPILFAGQGLRYRKLEVILTTVSHHLDSAMGSIRSSNPSLSSTLFLFLFDLLPDNRQTGESRGDGEGGPGVFPQPPDAQASCRPKHRQVCLPYQRTTQG